MEMSLLGRFVGSEERADQIRDEIRRHRDEHARRLRLLTAPARELPAAAPVVHVVQERRKRRLNVTRLAGRLLEHMTDDIIDIVVTVLQETKHGNQEPDGSGPGKTAVLGDGE